MKDLNKWMGIGNLCGDVETRYLTNGDAVSNFSIACNDDYKNKQTGEMVKQAEFVRIVAFRNLGEICNKYLRKGSKVYIEGKLQTRKWQDNNGNDRYTTEIVASDLQMLDSKQSDDF